MTTHEVTGDKMGEFGFACLRCRELDAEAEKVARDAEVQSRARAIGARSLAYRNSPENPAVKAEIQANKRKYLATNILILLVATAAMVTLMVLSGKSDPWAAIEWLLSKL